jgi:PAS domain S-box-containing protein
VEFVHPEDRAKVDAAFEDSLEKRTPSTVEYRIVMADGRVKVLEEHWEVFHDGQGRPTRLIGTCQDITRRKRMEEALRESEARFRLVSDSAPVMIWMSGTDKLCTYFNKPWLDFAGRSIDQELGNGWTDGVDSEDLQRCLDTYIQAFDRREAFRMEYRLRRHDGEYRWVSDIGVPRFNPDGSFAGYIGSCIDITEQKRAEEQLRHAQEDLARVTRVVAMGELAAAIAHEVNQPLTAIVTNANFSLRQLEDAIPHPGELRAAITEIVSDGTRASAVISRIRGLLAKATPRTTDLDINQIIQEVNILMHNEFTRNHVLLRTDLAADLPLVPGDAVELQQVLINLIMNAIEALRTSTDGRREILIRSAQNPDGVLIQVQDSGPGIAPEVADRIFEPFFTTKPEGIGMGLAISRSIVESHGGNLWAESSYNGALIQFTLPSK